MQNHLVIFAKEPRLGRVKTRLARDVGAVQAVAVYKRLLRQTVQRLNGQGAWKTWLAVSPDNSRTACFPVRKLDILKQGTGDLGTRMLRPAYRLPPGRFIVIGSDIAPVKARHIRKAFRLLGNHDAVFGPSEDGGFWLVGLKRHPVLINPYSKGVRWSHSETLQDCLDNLKGRKVALADTLWDVDTVDDLRRWCENG